MWVVIVWIILCILVAVLASKKGRSSIIYFFISFFLSPLFGLVILLIMGKKVKEVSNAERTITKKNKTNNNNEIINIDNECSRLFLEKHFTPYDKDKIREVLISSYDKKFEPSIQVDEPQRFILKGTSKEYESNNIRLRVEDDGFLIESYRIQIPQQLIKKEIEAISTNNVDNLVKLSNLLKEGLLTKDEFEKQKAILLNK